MEIQNQNQQKETKDKTSLKISKWVGGKVKVVDKVSTLPLPSLPCVVNIILRNFIMDEFPSQGDLRIILIPCHGRASTVFLPPFYVLTVSNFFSQYITSDHFLLPQTTPKANRVQVGTRLKSATHR